ncbi:hypothetical protein [Mycolicibacterium canariasense]|uniref:hypothetical protein n=1 Tax=Mycolicibacterium canariasense TaxID=228230 RepID=UPI000A168CD5|nr:hypothetical protein [Mycolicibacterium canariasense]MCV7208338.1 hypothetical protein [Mycolicibacterium canariasense]ORV13526.1 hypothetical protein AWB94_04700 [Mycolicibacterium canariasense]
MAYGKWEPEWIDPTEAQIHLATLRAAGLGHRRLSKLTGLSRPTLQQIPRVTRVSRKTRDAILAVPIPVTALFHPVFAPGTQISAIGSQRRLRALAAIGWDSETVGALLGGSRHRVTTITSGRQTKVTVARARTIAELFNQLHMKPGPSAKARRLAELKGWDVPFAWDEDTIDNPSAEPDTGEKRWVSTSERINEIRNDLGIHAVEQIAQILGKKPRTVERQLNRMQEAS